MRILVFERVFGKLKSCWKWENRVHIRPLAVRLGGTPGEIQERHKARKDGTNPVKREALPATRRAAAGGERHGKEGQTNRRCWRRNEVEFEGRMQRKEEKRWNCSEWLKSKWINCWWRVEWKKRMHGEKAAATKAVMSEANLMNKLTC